MNMQSAPPRPAQAGLAHLHGLDCLGKGQVIVVHGEACCDSLAKASGRHVVGWLSGQCVDRIDWSPLAGRDVVIWPNADEPGEATAREIAKIIADMGGRARIMDVTKAARWNGKAPPEGWSPSDAISLLGSRQALDSFMRETVGASVVSSLPPGVLGGEATRTSDDVAPLHAKALSAARKPAAGVSGLDQTRLPDFVHLGSDVECARILARQVAEACGGPVVKAEGAFWAFGPTHWRPLPEADLRLAAHSFDGVQLGSGTRPLKVGKRMLDGILFELGTILDAPDFFFDQPTGVNVSNGVVTITDDGLITLRPHSPDDRFRFTIAAEFHLHREMDPPEGSSLRRLLHGAFAGDPDGEDKIKLVGEMLGAAAFGIAANRPEPKAFIFLGESARNGKSTIASLLTCLLPAGAVSSIPPSAFGDERRIINLAGKAANVADELSASAISGETFKAAVTGNPIEGRDLYRSAVTFTPRALMCFTTNTLPRFNGGLDRGLQRRLVVLRFNRSIPECEIIPDIADRIRRDELELLLGFAIAGAQRLIRDRGYTIPASSHEALREWMLIEPINEWFAERIEAATEKPYPDWPRTVDLHQDFKAWAIENGYAERLLPPVNTFGQQLKAMPGVEIRRNNGARAYWIKLKGGTYSGF